MTAIHPAAGRDSIVGDQTAKLCDFIYDNVGRANVHTHQAKFGEYTGKRFRF